MKTKYLQTLVSGLALAVVLCPQAFAHTWETKTCSDSNGIGCWKCGNNCTATLHQDGKLVVSGTGTISGGSGGNNTFSGLSVKPTSLIIEEGITSVQTNAFWAVSTIRSLDLPGSLTAVGPDGLTFGGSISKLAVGETNFSIGYNPGNFNIPLGKNVEVFCRGDIDKCRNGKGGLFSVAGKTIKFTNELRDENGKLLEKWSANGYEAYDENENIIGKYDKQRKLIAQYSYNTDGSIEIYDANGKLTGLKNAREITPAQAAELAKDGKNNTVTLTFK